LFDNLQTFGLRCRRTKNEEDAALAAMDRYVTLVLKFPKSVVDLPPFEVKGTRFKPKYPVWYTLR
jgi:hypothetical protein